MVSQSKGDERNNLEYKKRYVAFLDVLGFKNLVLKRSDKQLKDYLDIVESSLEEIKEIDGKSIIDSIVVSDSVVLVMKCDRARIDRFRHFCVAIGLIQSRLAVRGLWLRGAISMGDISFCNRLKQIIGKPYITAYELEQTKAIYPRVILDTEIIEELDCKDSQELIRDINDKTFCNWSFPILYDPNQVPRAYRSNVNTVFIDYINPIIGDSETSSPGSTRTLDEVIKTIEDNINADAKIAEKYRWLATYLREKLLVQNKEEQYSDSISTLEQILLNFESYQSNYGLIGS